MPVEPEGESATVLGVMGPCFRQLLLDKHFPEVPDLTAGPMLPYAQIRDAACTQKPRLFRQLANGCFRHRLTWLNGPFHKLRTCEWVLEQQHFGVFAD